jgi:hypothetical protein
MTNIQQTQTAPTLRRTPTKTIQDIQLDLIELASFNLFDGEQVKQDLIENRELWKGAIMGRFESFPLIPLRDIESDTWNVDTLMILPREGREQELLELAATWRPDELDLSEGDDVKMLLGGAEDKVVRAWWD